MKDEIDKTCRTQGEIINAYKILVGKLKNHLQT
jgi:hypothetical protein